MSPSDADGDPVVTQYRSQISENDLAIVEAVNRRISLVSRLFAYKREHGYAILDQEREQRLLAHVTRANKGPISNDRLEELYRYLLDMTKTEEQRLSEHRDA